AAARDTRRQHALRVAAGPGHALRAPGLQHVLDVPQLDVERAHRPEGSAPRLHASGLERLAVVRVVLDDQIEQVVDRRRRGADTLRAVARMHRLLLAELAPRLFGILGRRVRRLPVIALARHRVAEPVVTPATALQPLAEQASCARRARLTSSSHRPKPPGRAPYRGATTVTIAVTEGRLGVAEN